MSGMMKDDMMNKEPVMQDNMMKEPMMKDNMMKDHMSETIPPKMQYHDYCVIGAGPSGLQLGYYFKKAGRDYILFERNNVPGKLSENSPVIITDLN
jgi:NADPH-dependent glutamate synthase beta subunit-like oxidoreductase